MEKHLYTKYMKAMAKDSAAFGFGYLLLCLIRVAKHEGKEDIADSLKKVYDLHKDERGIII